MKDITKLVKATIEGKVKEDTIQISIPEHLTESIQKFGEDTVYKIFIRTLITDKCNIHRLAMKGGEAKLKRQKEKQLLEKMLTDPDLRTEVAKLANIDL